MEKCLTSAAPQALLQAGRLKVSLAVLYVHRKFSMETTVTWNSQEFWLTHERVELLGDSHLKVETRSRDLDTVITSRIF